MLERGSGRINSAKSKKLDNSSSYYALQSENFDLETITPNA
ncbi:hypothetical protein FJSC11DRAFT_0813 [Fischerella thermalis JSC-11]|jgi:hypothetical protein|uniref:Uncharacterized protein n=1 Tax=Fischerella thermalis JSC-11 TaxID=741277 RepID=G6FPN3_9CYAN|nr:hypothetical protein FJSC11DRAFT_0813 [Fischerella thermalis JSC-11]